jgi:hypothetical protein
MTDKEQIEKVLRQKHCNGMFCYTIEQTCPMLKAMCTPGTFSYPQVKELAKDYFTDEELFEILL